jgi:hypothetical protein
MPSLIHALILGAATMATSENIVRREHKADSLHLSAVGETIGGSSRPAEQIGTKINTCDDDFPLGQLNKNACTETHFDYPILDRQVCIEAAKEAGVMTVHSKFELPADGGWRNVHPRGCFKIPCSEAHAATGHATGANDTEKQAAESHDNGGYCYFYNPIEQNPQDDADQLTGVPVCYRPKIINGTIADATSGSGKVVQCKAGFKVIDNENDCRAAAECLGLGQGDDQFQISLQVNAMYQEYPEGCFIHVNGNVYINLRPNQVDGQALWGNPTDPEGNMATVATPLCNVTETTLADTWPTLSTTDHNATL